MLHSRRQKTTVILVVVALSAVFATASLLLVHVLLSAQAASYQDRCGLYAVALASSSSSWLPPLGVDDAPQLVYPLLGVFYLRVEAKHEILLDHREARFADAVLPTLDRAPVVATQVFRHRGFWVIDVTIPHTVSATVSGDYPQSDEPAVLQFGIDATQLRHDAILTMNRIIAGSFVLWVLGLGALWFGHELKRRHRPQTSDPQRRPSPDASRQLSIDGVVLLMDELQLKVGEQSINITPKQTCLLEVLFKQPGRTFSDEDLIRLVWADSPYASSSDVKQQIYLIRRRLRQAGLLAEDILITVPGIGYKLNPSLDDAVVDALSIDSSQC